jgi:lon-related putative ATP-dependent protease
MKAFRLKPEQLTCQCDVGCLDFTTTDELPALQGLLAQDRATKALDFGLSIKKKGYNVYVSGSWGTGRTSYVQKIAEKKSAQKPAPMDWIYVNNFENAHQPKAIPLKTGTAKEFVKWMEKTIGFLRKEIQTVFSSKDYENTRSLILKQYQGNTAQVIEDLNVIGSQYGFRFSQNERGLISIPLRGGEPMTEEEYKNITDEDYELMKSNSEKLSLETIELFNKIRMEEEDYRKKIHELDGEMGRRVVSYHVMKIQENFECSAKLVEFLEALTKDIVENIEQFKSSGGSSAHEDTNPLAMLAMRSTENFFDRYRINLFIDNSEKTTAPMKFESNPTYSNLIGSIEYRNELGVMKTDFMQIKSGALHEANGGYLILHAKDLLQSMYAWKGLKRALLDEQIAIEGLGAQSGYVVATTLKPEAVPLDVKVIIIGDSYSYQLLYHYDEEFRKLFKIESDFDTEMIRSADNMEKMARFIAKHCEHQKLKPFDKLAVGRIIEYSSRLADHQSKMSTHLSGIVDILIEADEWASKSGDQIIRKAHVETALEERRLRANAYEEKVHELFDEGVYLLDVEGAKVGEINGLAVVGTGQYSFGKPSKITVSTYRGQAGLINIEREARTSGKLHDKGILIISGYMGQKYAQDKPLALTASIVFEQLYSGVDGDSASSTELYGILSSLANLPIKQSLAVTGSVNQRGDIQPIGGVNEKIEGFYKICRLKGLTGNQGVMIPHQNVKNLMLSSDVIEAVKANMFHIYAVKSIDDGIEVLTGVPAGKPDKDGKYPKDTVHYLVNKRLEELARPLKQRAGDLEDKKAPKAKKDLKAEK